VPRGRVQRPVERLLHAVRWHGNTVRVPTTLGQQFGYVDPGNTGYRGDLTNAQGTPWGCTDVGSPASATSGCTTYYVACR
jgi:hypothetical protein